MPRQSAGLLMYRPGADQQLDVFLVHMGGPLWSKKDEGAWSIPKGEFEDPESPFDAALREFREETGLTPPDGPFVPLKTVRLASGKWIHSWAVRGDCDASQIHSNEFTMEWPPKSGRQRQFPEVDRAAWFTLAEARTKILKSLAPLLDQLEALF